MVNIEEKKAIEFRKTIEDIYRSNSGTPLSLAVQEATERSDKVRAPWSNDVMFFRYAVVGLIVITLAVVICSSIVLGTGNAPTDGLIAIGSAAVGALVGIFTKPDSTNGTKT